MRAHSTSSLYLFRCQRLNNPPYLLHNTTQWLLSFHQVFLHLFAAGVIVLRSFHFHHALLNNELAGYTINKIAAVKANAGTIFACI